MNTPCAVMHRGLVFLVLLVACAALQAAESEVVRLSEPVDSGASYETFGARVPESGAALTLGELIANSEDHLGNEVMVNTRIARVCQKKGCFFVAQEGAVSARITFRDYGFFIPTDSGGRDVTLVGILSRKPLSVEEAQHYARDLGEAEPVDAPAFEYAIVATAVKIHRG